MLRRVTNRCQCLRLMKNAHSSRDAKSSQGTPNLRRRTEKTNSPRSKQQKAERFQKRPIEHLHWLVSVSSKKLVESAIVFGISIHISLHGRRINPQVSNWMLAKKELSIGFLSAKVTVFPDQFHCGPRMYISEMMPYILSTIYIYINTYIHVNVSNHIFYYNLSKPTMILISVTHCEKRVSMRDCHATEVVSAAPAKGCRFGEETGPNSRQPKLGCWIFQKGINKFRDSWIMNDTDK